MSFIQLIWIAIEWFCDIVYNFFYSFQSKDSSNDIPVLLVANKTDQVRDCGISREDGHRRYRELGCVGFKEISVRESIEQVLRNHVIHNICNWKIEDSLIEENTINIFSVRFGAYFMTYGKRGN